MLLMSLFVDKFQYSFLPKSCKSFLGPFSLCQISGTLILNFEQCEKIGEERGACQKISHCSCPIFQIAVYNGM